MVSSVAHDDQAGSDYDDYDHFELALVVALPNPSDDVVHFSDTLMASLYSGMDSAASTIFLAGSGLRLAGCNSQVAAAFHSSLYSPLHPQEGLL